MADEPTNDADVLFPDVELTLNKRTFTVREFTFLQGLKMARQVQPLLCDMQALLAADDATDIANLGNLFADHDTELTLLLQTSTGQDAQWIASLRDSDGQKLLLTFWSVNKDFFINRLLLQTLAKQKNQKQQASDSASSLPA